MSISIGLLELKSIPMGIKTADEMLKAADVELLLASAICPGKYVIVISGNVGPVKSAMKVGVCLADSFLIAEHTINNVHESIPAAVLGLSDVGEIESLGIIETISALTSIRAADVAAKAANIRLIEVRIARGLGGKGYLIFTGNVAAVNSAMRSCEAELEETGEITSSSIIASPHPSLIEKII